ncbi:MAG: oligoribonuclease [Acidimicrobiia bacterium]
MADATSTETGTEKAAGPPDDRLAWLDLEMTGLDTNRHTIVEIALLITDAELNVVDDGIDLVVHATPDELARMDDFVVGMHTKSGLLPQIQAATLSLPAAGDQVLAYLRDRVAEHSAPLCGNSIGVDRRFLDRYLPAVDQYLHYRSIDVSSLKELARRWHPEVLKGQPAKRSTHRALDDIRESIEELRYYREAFLILPEPEGTSDA